MIRFSCPTCQTVLQADAEQAGATVVCPRCKVKAQVPGTVPAATSASVSAAATSPASTSVAWFFTRAGRKCGPFSEAQFKQLTDSARILPADLVWKEGMLGWGAVASVGNPRGCSPQSSRRSRGLPCGNRRCPRLPRHSPKRRPLIPLSAWPPPTPALGTSPSGSGTASVPRSSWELSRGHWRCRCCWPWSLSSWYLASLTDTHSSEAWTFQTSPRSITRKGRTARNLKHER